MKKIIRIASALSAAVLCFSISGCAKTSTTDVSSYDISKIHEDSEVSALVPAQYREVLKVASYMPYSPAEFYNEKNEAVGYEIDLVHALAKVMGIKRVEITGVEFDDIFPGLENGTYDFAASALTITKERLSKSNMIAYINSGYIYGTQKGNPKNFDYGNPCGTKIATEANSSQEELLQDLSQTCIKNQANPIEIVADKDQDSLINQVASGSIDAIIGESAIIKYAETKNQNFASLGESFQRAPQGMVVAKNNEALAKATQAALQKLIDQGQLEKVLAPWGVESFALHYATLNPPIA